MIINERVGRTFKFILMNGDVITGEVRVNNAFRDSDAIREELKERFITVKTRTNVILLNRDYIREIKIA